MRLNTGYPAGPEKTLDALVLKRFDYEVSV
jgi:hypothetical protein